MPRSQHRSVEQTRWDPARMSIYWKHESRHTYNRENICPIQRAPHVRHASSKSRERRTAKECGEEATDELRFYVRG